MNGNYYCYMRISTTTEKQSFARQEQALAKYAKVNDIEYLVEFKEEKSAKNFEDRKEFNKLDKIIHAGDTVVMKDISRFTRQGEEGYKKYMEWLERGINIVFIDNPTISTDYINKMMDVAKSQDLVTKTALEGTIKLLIIVELDRAEQTRLYISKAITDGIKASDKQSGRKVGKLDKISQELKQDIQKFLADRSIKQVDLMNKHEISRNTLKKYIALAREGKL